MTMKDHERAQALAALDAVVGFMHLVRSGVMRGRDDEALQNLMESQDAATVVSNLLTMSVNGGLMVTNHMPADAPPGQS